MFVPLVLPPSEWYCSWPVNISYLVSLPWMKGRKFNPGICLTTHIQISTCKLCWLLHIRNDHSVEATVFNASILKGFTLCYSCEFSNEYTVHQSYAASGSRRDANSLCLAMRWSCRLFWFRLMKKGIYREVGASCTGWGGLCDPQGKLCNTCVCWVYCDSSIAVIRAHQKQLESLFWPMALDS